MGFAVRKSGLFLSTEEKPEPKAVFDEYKV
jgi:hypothetical protein